MLIDQAQEQQVPGLEPGMQSTRKSQRIGKVDRSRNGCGAKPGNSEGGKLI